MNKKKNYAPLIWTLTILINGLVFTLFLLPEKTWYDQYDFSFLPGLNALFNSGTFIFLVLGLLAIKKKKIMLHKRFVLSAFFCTSLFLISYVLYHFTTPSTPYGGEGVLRVVYFSLLITHIFLAAIIVPLALFSMGYGLNMQVEKHRKIARWTMPIWLYVSLTGVIIYLMLSPYYAH